MSDVEIQVWCEQKVCHESVDHPRAWNFVVFNIQRSQGGRSSQEARSFANRRHLVVANSDLHDGNHWFLVAWDGRRLRAGDVVYVWDSLAEKKSGNGTDAFVAQLKTFGLVPHVQWLGHQMDGWTCGYQSIHGLRKLLQHADTPWEQLGDVKWPVMPLSFTREVQAVVNAEQQTRDAIVQRMVDAAPGCTPKNVAVGETLYVLRWQPDHENGQSLVWQPGSVTSLVTGNTHLRIKVSGPKGTNQPVLCSTALTRREDPR